MTDDFKWLTGRDRKVYNFLKFNAKYMSTSQITELFFKVDEKGRKINYPEIICRRRLRQMEEKLPDFTSFFRQANSDKIFTTQAPKAEKIVTMGQIEHSLRINDVYITIYNYAKQRNHIIHDVLIEKGIMNDIIPDMLIIYVISGEARIYFIEYDRGTETLNRIRKKLSKYLSYYGKQLFLHEDWQPGSIRPHLIFLCEGERRAQNIDNLINSMGMGSYSRGTTDIFSVLDADSSLRKSNPQI